MGPLLVDLCLGEATKVENSKPGQNLSDIYLECRHNLSYITDRAVENDCSPSFGFEKRLKKYAFLNSRSSRASLGGGREDLATTAGCTAGCLQYRSPARKDSTNKIAGGALLSAQDQVCAL